MTGIIIVLGSSSQQILKLDPQPKKLTIQKIAKKVSHCALTRRLDR